MVLLIFSNQIDNDICFASPKVYIFLRKSLIVQAMMFLHSLYLSECCKIASYNSEKHNEISAGSKWLHVVWIPKINYLWLD